MGTSSARASRGRSSRILSWILVMARVVLRDRDHVISRCSCSLSTSLFAFAFVLIVLVLLTLLRLISATWLSCPAGPKPPSLLSYQPRMCSCSAKTWILEDVAQQVPASSGIHRRGCNGEHNDAALRDASPASQASRERLEAREPPGSPSWRSSMRSNPSACPSGSAALTATTRWSL